MFYQHNFKFNDELVEKKYLVTFFNADNKNNLCFAPKITYAHIFPGPFEKVRIYLAAQVFSASVFTGLLLYLQSNIWSNISLPTINCINNMDKLFLIYLIHSRNLD